MTDNCAECAKAGATTECQYMEFPPGVHHYFEQKVCTYHYWHLYARQKKGWEEYLKFAKFDSGSAGYVLTFPPEALMKPEGGSAAGVPAVVQAPPTIPEEKASAKPAPPEQQAPP